MAGGCNMNCWNTFSDTTEITSSAFFKQLKKLLQTVPFLYFFADWLERLSLLDVTTFFFHAEMTNVEPALSCDEAESG